MGRSRSLTLILLVLLATFFSLASVSSCFATSPALTVISGVGGTTNPSSGTYTNFTSSWDISPNWNISPEWNIINSSIVTIYGLPQSGYTFGHWLVNGSSAGSSNPLTFTMTAPTSVQPVFTVTVSPPPPIIFGPSTVFVLTVSVKNQTIPIVGVTVSIGSSHATTDIKGTATFNLPFGAYTVSVSYQGITQKQIVTLTTSKQISFDLSSSSSLSNLQLYAPAIIIAVILVIAIGVILLVRRRK